MAGERTAASVPWWKDSVRSWVPVLALAALFFFQMVSLQQQIGGVRSELQGEIRTQIREEMGMVRADIQKDMEKLRADLQEDISGIRGDISGIRDDISDLRGEVADLRVDLGERITRLETLMEARPEASRSGG